MEQKPIEIALNYDKNLAINITPMEDEKTWVPMCKGFSNLSTALNEVIQQFTWLCSGGWGSSVVTGGQYTVTLTGQRVYGDPAQDFIFGPDVQYRFGKYRETQLKITIPETGIAILWDVTLANISETGGDANNFSAISITIHGNGAPVIDMGLLEQLIVATTPGEQPNETLVVVNPLLATGNSYKYQIGETVELPAYNEVLAGTWNEWDGDAPITVTAGALKIVVAETDADNAAKKAGIGTIHSA